VEKANEFEEGMTPLHMACSSGHLAVAKLLLAEGAHVDKWDNKGGIMH